MTIKRVLIIIFCFGRILVSDAQLNTYINVYAGPNWDQCRVKSGHNFLNTANIQNAIAGVQINQYLSPGFSFSFGSWYHTYYTGININDSRKSQASTLSYRMLLFPAEFAIQSSFEGLPIYLNTHIGYQMGLLIGDIQTNNSSSVISTKDFTSFAYESIETHEEDKLYHFASIGTSLDYVFATNWKASLQLKYVVGISRIVRSDFVYHNSSVSYNGQYASNGNRWQSTLSLGIPVSNLWQNKSYRMHHRIESSRNEGLKNRRKRHIYFGTDLGIVHRSFSGNNPAIAARPMNKRGLFRYNNLHGGILFAYVNAGGTAFETGAYYQRSSTILSVMYDHEVDASIKERAPFYLEFPLLLMHNFETIVEELNFTPILGFGVLSHFASSAIGSGSTNFEYTHPNGSSHATLTYDATRLYRFGFNIKLGAGIEYQLPINLPLSAYARIIYNHGVRSLDQINVSTGIPNENPTPSIIQYDGSGWKASIGIKYAILLGKENKACGAESRFR